MTNWHSIPVQRVIAGNKTFVEVYAKDLKLGDIVLITDGHEHREGAITALQTVFIPQKDCILLWTPSMNIVVDGVVSSCYTRGWRAVPKFAHPLAAQFAMNF